MEGCLNVVLPEDLTEHPFECFLTQSLTGPFQTVFPSARVGKVSVFGKYLKYTIAPINRATPAERQPAPDAFQVLLKAQLTLFTLLYTQCKLKGSESLCLMALLTDAWYSCGSLLSKLIGNEASPLQKEIIARVFARANITCADKVETPYYSAEMFDSVCIHSGNPDDIVTGEEAADILPTCRLFSSNARNLQTKAESNATCCKETSTAISDPLTHCVCLASFPGFTAFRRSKAWEIFPVI